jgi:ferritin-like metal-binding protein YciE
MKLVIEKLPDLQALYIRQLRLLLSAEEQIVRGMPIMIETAVDTQLKQAFQSHLQETDVHITRVRNILETIAGQAEPIKCKVMSALIDEVEDQVQSCSHESVRDAALIAGAQRIEHYEIATYGALRHFAQVLGRTSDAENLDQTIHEEGHADHLLTTIAERVNPTAQRVRAA